MSDIFFDEKKILDLFDIKKNDRLLISSNLLPLLNKYKEKNKNFDHNIFLESLISKVGKDGTILIPSFNFDFCSGKTYDYNNSSPTTGALARIALKRNDFKRTIHPIHSFLVFGKDQKYLCNLKNISSFGPDSPFNYMHKNEVKNFVIGINYKRTLTIDHYCEEVVGVDYRFLKEFKSFYINEKREKKIKSYKMYVRKNPEESIETGINSILDDFLIKKNAYKNYNINNVEFNLVNLKIAADVLINDLKNNKKILYLKKNN